MSQRAQSWKQVGGKLWIGYCLLTVVIAALGGYRQSLAVLEQIRPLQAAEDAGVVLTAMGIGTGLWASHPVFKWWIGRLFIGSKKAGPGENFNLAPVRVPVLGPVYLVVLAFVMPQICHGEETVFRGGTTDWRDAVIRSLLFGATHILVGVPIAAALAIAVAGLWFSYAFFHGGVAASTVHHTTYNLFIVLVLLVLTTTIQVKGYRERQATNQTPPAEQCEQEQGTGETA